MLLMIGTVHAQRDLQCYPVFQGKVVPGKDMLITEIRGSSMVTYNLDYFRGVSFQVDEKLAGEVAALVEKDASAATVREIEKSGDLLTYALVQPKGKGKTNRYLCYQARPIAGQWKVTILYLEGPASLEELRSMFEKQ